MNAVMQPKFKVLKEINLETLTTISYSYSSPMQTGINQWSVFVKKFENTDCVGVIEHKFKTEKDADAFSKNNWNLGDYF